MSDRELLTECLDVLTHDAAQRTFAGGVRMSQLAIKLRAHLAAPEPVRHPGYILGSHWLETAYSRICAGEAEDAILEDYEVVREPRLRDLRLNDARYRWIRDNHEIKGRAMEIVYNSNGKEWDADIDWAMQEDKT